MNGSRRPLLASERVRLYLTLVPYLLERQPVSLIEAAADFDVEPEQLRGMVEKLTLIGLPGEEGYWQMPQEQFDINWDLLDDEGIIEITNDVALRRVPRLTAREAAALLAGLQLVASLPEVADSELVTELLSKLARGAATAPAEVVIAPPALDEVRSVVTRALRDSVAVTFTYQAVDAPSVTRTVDPVRVLNTDSEWYVQGWCHLRQAMRTFHLDRISDPVLTNIPNEHIGRQAPPLFQGTDEDSVGEMRMPASIASMIADVLAHAEVTEAEDPVHVRMRMSDPRSLRRLAARFGGRLEVLGPAAARGATREWAEAGLALYHQPITGSAG